MKVRSVQRFSLEKIKETREFPWRLEFYKTGLWNTYIPSLTYICLEKLSNSAYNGVKDKIKTMLRENYEN